MAQVENEIWKPLGDGIWSQVRAQMFNEPLGRAVQADSIKIRVESAFGFSA
jgi:hypothetical protein